MTRTRLLFEDDADFVIVGTGAGGATAARVLTDAGYDVVMLEEGPHLSAEERPRDALGTLAQGMRGCATTVTAGTTPMPLLQGRLVGGSTALNSGIIWRMPEEVRDEWIDGYGLGDLVGARIQEPIYEQLEQELEVSEMGSDVRGGNGHLLERAARRLGLPGQPTHRNAARCRGSAECLQGCRGDARQSMDVAYVLWAVSRGARLHPLTRVRRVRTRRGHAVGVDADVVDATTGRGRGGAFVRARRGVVVSAGVVQTPVILHRSGLRRMVGERFQVHPGVAVVGRFPEAVTMAFGATQSYEVPLRERGYKLESLSLPPELLAARIPGTGAAWQERLTELDHYAQWAAQLHLRAHGRVRPGWTTNAEPVVRYEPESEDLAVTRESIGLICRMMFAVGATEVYPGVGGVPAVLTRESEVDALERLSLDRWRFHLVASHLFGTACAGADPRTSVVGPNLESHDVAGLHVMDASVFPTNLGTNPQHSIMAVCWRAAEQLANREASPRAA